MTNNSKIEEISLDTIEMINRIHNEDSNPWVRRDLLEMTYSSYFYYDDVIEQISSIFRNLLKNHPFSNANKRTAALILLIYLSRLKFTLDDNFLVKLCYEIIDNDYSIDTISNKIKDNMIKINAL